MIDHPQLLNWDLEYLHRLLFYLTDWQAKIEDNILQSKRESARDRVVVYENQVFLINRLLIEARETIRRKEL